MAIKWQEVPGRTAEKKSCEALSNTHKKQNVNISKSFSTYYSVNETECLMFKLMTFVLCLQNATTATRKVTTSVEVLLITCTDYSLDIQKRFHFDIMLMIKKNKKKQS